MKNISKVFTVPRQQIMGNEIGQKTTHSEVNRESFIGSLLNKLHYSTQNNSPQSWKIAHF